MRRFQCMLIATTLCSLFLFWQGSAEAGERQRSGSYVTGKGRAGSYQSNVSGQRKSGLNINQSITNSNGKTFSRSSVTTYDKSTGSYNKNVTGPQGTVRTYNGGGTIGNREGSYSTSNGKSGTYTRTATKNDDGTVSTGTTWTNQNGETRATSGTYGYDKQTKTISGAHTGVQGNTREGSVTVTPNGQ